jgi:hypothetical protein
MTRLSELNATRLRLADEVRAFRLLNTYNRTAEERILMTREYQRAFYALMRAEEAYRRAGLDSVGADGLEDIFWEDENERL